VAEGLLDGGGEERRVVEHEGELVGVLHELLNGVADEVGGGLVPGHQEEEQHLEQLGRAELRTIGVRGGHQPADEVAARFGAALLDDGGEIRGHLFENRLVDLAAAVDGGRTELLHYLVRPELEARAVRGRDAHDLGDDDDGQRIGERVHDVGLALASDGVEELARDVADAGLEQFHHARGEGLGDEAAEAGVVGRVAAEHARATLLFALGLGPVGGKGVVALQDLDAIVVAEGEPEPQGLDEGDRHRLAAHLIEGEWVFEEGGIVGVEASLGNAGHHASSRGTSA
jgi:hypothetical protein